jgi:hypothetical protein
LHKNNSSQPRIGRILVEKNYLQQEDLEKVHKEQSKAAFFEILSWQKGSFTFVINSKPQGEDIFLQERIDHLTLEGVLHADELANRSDDVGLELIANMELAVELI